MTADDFKQQFMPYAQKLYNIAFHILGNSNEASDAVQDTFLKIWDKRDKIEYANAEAFSVTILKNVCLDMLKKRKPTNNLTQIEQTESEQNLNCQIEWHDNWILMKSLIKKLSPLQQQIIKLRHINGLDYADIATRTGLKESNIRAIITRTRQTLRNEFDKITNKN